MNPVMMQGVVQRTPDYSQMKQQEDVRAQTLQTGTVMRTEKEKKLQQEQVVKKNNADAKENKFDAKEKGNGTYYGQSKQKKKSMEQDGTVTMKHSGGFDVKV